MTDLAVSDFEVTALALQHCGLDPSRQMTGAERKAVDQAERLLRLYLMRTSIERKYTNAEQGAALGVSVATVKRMANSEEYAKIAAFMAPANRSPIMPEAKAFLQEELLPAALRSALELLDDDEVRPSTKANLIGQVMKFAFQDRGDGDGEVQRRDAMEFLKHQGLQTVNIGQIVVNQSLAPADYAEKLQEAFGVVDGEVAELASGEEQ